MGWFHWEFVVVMVVIGLGALWYEKRHETPQTPFDTPSKKYMKDLMKDIREGKLQHIPIPQDQPIQVKKSPWDYRRGQ